jgi:hypothetical protein
MTDFLKILKYQYVNKTNKCTYTLYILSLFTKTLKSPTCFGLIDHPQGARTVPGWLLKFKNSRKTLVKMVWQHMPETCRGF